MTHPPQSQPQQSSGFQPQPGNPAPQYSGPTSRPPMQQPSGPAPRPSGPAPQFSGPAPVGVQPSAPRPDAGPGGGSAPISPQPQRDVEPRTPRFRRHDLSISTGEDFPGAVITEVLGPVFGVVTRPRDMAHSPEMSYLITEARQDAVAALVVQAQEAGADAVVGLRFDGGQLSETVSEITAYGTAVRLGRA